MFLYKKVTSAQFVADPSRGSSDAPSKSVSGSAATPKKAHLPISPALRVQQARELTENLRPFITGKLKLTVTDNKAVMISVQRDLKHSIFNVRLHHLFVSAPEPILRYLGEYIVKNDRLASKKLNVFIDQHHEKIRLARSRENRLSIQTAGRFYDLQEIFNKLNAQYFGGKVRSRITWGKSVCMGKARRSIKVGSFHVEVKLIRIHPGLDQEWIPYFYIEWVVYHEMLHALHPIPVVHGRRRFHTKEFSKDEQRFSEYASAIEWEKRNIAALLCL